MKYVAVDVQEGFSNVYQEVGIATKGWTTKGSEFEFREGQEFSLIQIVQTGSGVHTTSYPTRTGSSFPGGKVAGA
jgi:hypothetical protein